MMITEQKLVRLATESWNAEPAEQRLTEDFGTYVREFVTDLADGWDWDEGMVDEALSAADALVELAALSVRFEQVPVTVDGRGYSINVPA